MTRTIFSKVTRLAKVTSTVVGLAIMLALVFGVASMALGANGNPWILGQGNVATAITVLGGAAGVDGPMVRLTNNNAGTNDTALSLDVQSGEPPMTVNSDRMVPNLNADQLDGKDASEMGVNGLERVVVESDYNSNSHKRVFAEYPSGKVVVGSGAVIRGGESNFYPNRQTDVVFNAILPDREYVYVQGLEESSTSLNWAVQAIAICATAP